MRKIGESVRDKRLRFKPNLQRKFVEEIKDKSGLTWIQLSKELNISVHTIMFDWRNEKSTLPDKIAKELLRKYPFERWENIEHGWVKEVLAENWRQKLICEKIKKKIDIPQKNEELAEILGAILGDGHLERKTLTITGNSSEEEHQRYLAKQIKKLFGLNSKIFKLKGQNANQLKINSVELIKFLLNNSFVLGNKIKNKEFLPKWVFEKKEFMYGALRGLFDTDGGIYQKQKKYKRAIIEFQTKSPYIRNDLYRLIRGIGLTPSKSSGNIRIQDQKEVKKFLSMVGCSNPKNIIKCKYFIEMGEIPPKERLYNEIINLKIEKPFKAPLI